MQLHGKFLFYILFWNMTEYITNSEQASKHLQEHVI